MKWIFWILVLSLGLTAPLGVRADGYPEEKKPKTKVYRKAAEPTPLPTPPPTCIPTSRQPKVRLVSWNDRLPMKKILGEITECVTTMWEVLALLPGPNIINKTYPSEKEQWGYSWLWSYKLQNPIEDTIILMDNPGKRIRKGKNPVEMYIVFNEDDIVERVEIELIKK